LSIRQAGAVSRSGARGSRESASCARPSATTGCGIWERVARVIGCNPRPIWIGTAIVLVALAFGSTGIETRLTQAQRFNAGQIPALKTGKDFRYSWQAVREVLRQPHRQPGEAAHDPTDQPKKGAGYRAQHRARTGAHDPTE
jgi:hypothetical protein